MAQVKKSTKKEMAQEEVVTTNMIENGTDEFLAGNFNPPTVEDFVFMEKTAKLLEIGLKTEKNIVLYGPGE